MLSRIRKKVVRICKGRLKSVGETQETRTCRQGAAKLQSELVLRTSRHTRSLEQGCACVALARNSESQQPGVPALPSVSVHP